MEEIIPDCPGYYSRIFLVPKKNGQLRLIIDLSVLNHFVYTETFKVETQRKVRNDVQLNDWAFSLDLRRLFAYPDTSSVSQIHQIHIERSSVPVQGTPIQPLDKSFRVYTPYDCHSDIPKEKGDNSTSLSRRLGSSKPKPSKTVGTQTIHFVADQFPRSDNYEKSDLVSSPEPLGSQGELIVYPSSRRPSSVVVVVNNFKHLLLQNRWADQSQILCGASLGRGNDILFAASGSHDQDGRHAHIW